MFPFCRDRLILDGCPDIWCGPQNVGEFLFESLRILRWPRFGDLSQVAAEPQGRCTYCYQSRLKKTAEYAARNDYDAFTSSLLYSRYQNHALIRKVGEELAQHYGIPFFYDDYRVGWQEGIRVSKEMGLYRQQYCGCIYSEKDRYHPNRSH
ncbi:MAG: epoxyqueuosine reductase QueH [Desulfuromonadales bacterium]